MSLREVQQNHSVAERKRDAAAGGRVVFEWSGMGSREGCPREQCPVRIEMIADSDGLPEKDTESNCRVSHIGPSLFNE
jgi:hypothetical protein